MTRKKGLDYVGECRFMPYNETAIGKWSNVKPSNKLAKELDKYEGHKRYNDIPLYDTTEPAEIDAYNGESGFALVNLNDGHVIASFVKGDNCIPAIKVSNNIYNDCDDLHSIYESQDTNTSVTIFTKTYRPYVDITIRADETGKPDINKMSRFMSRTRAKQIADYTDFDIAFVDLQTREIKDLGRTTRAFAGDISFILTSTNYGLHFMMMYMPFDYEQLAI